MLVLSGCAQEKRSFENSGPESGGQESTQAYVEPEREPLPEEERGSFILEDEEAVYACGYSRILKIDKQSNHTSVLWSSNNRRVEESYWFSDGRALLLQNKIYFIEMSDSGDGLGDVCVLSVINKDGTGYEQVEKMDGSNGGLFFVDGVLYITYIERAGDRERRTGAYEIHEDGGAVKIQNVYAETPYQYMPDGYREFECLTAPESYKRFGRLLLPFYQERQLAAMDPEAGGANMGTLVPLEGIVEAANDNLLLDVAHMNGEYYLFLVDGISLRSKVLGRYEEDDLHILGMDSEYIYAETKDCSGRSDEVEEQHIYSRISLETGEREELFTLKEMEPKWNQMYFPPYRMDAMLRERSIYYSEWRDYKLYLMRVNTDSPGQEVLGEAYYDSGISNVGRLEPYREEIYSQSEPGVVISRIALDRLVIDDRFPGALKINQYLEEVQRENIAFEKNVIGRLEEESRDDLEYLPAYELSGGVSEIYYFDGTYVSFYLVEYDYRGGAHGLPYWYGQTFNLETGKKLALDDIIDNSEEELRDIITRYFAGKIEKRPDYFWGAAVSEVRESAGYDTGFYLTRNGIRFYYPPYSLTCFAGGFQEITIPYSEFQMKIPVGREKMAGHVSEGLFTQD